MSDEPQSKYDIGDLCFVDGYDELQFVINDIAKLDNGSFIYWCDAINSSNSIAWMSEAQLFVPQPGKISKGRTK